MQLNHTILIAFVALGLSFSTATAQSQRIDRLGDFQDWSAFKFSENNAVTCFIAKRPHYYRRVVLVALYHPLEPDI